MNGPLTDGNSLVGANGGMGSNPLPDNTGSLGRTSPASLAAAPVPGDGDHDDGSGSSATDATVDLGEGSGSGLSDGPEYVDDRARVLRPRLLDDGDHSLERVPRADARSGARGRRTSGYRARR